MLLLGSSAAAAQSHLDLHIEHARLTGEWKIRVADLEPVLALDTNHDGDITWAELEPRRADIERHLRSRLKIVADDAEPVLRFDKLMYGTQNRESLLLSQFSLQAPADIRKIDVDDTDDRCFLKIIWAGTGKQEALLTPGSGVHRFARESASGSGFVDLLKEGIWHIWIGYDHVLFLLVLLIPAVFQRTTTGREAVPTFGAAFARVAIIVSAFTIAHSITLTCAAMQWVVLPGRLVESAIAGSIFVAAMLNFLPTTADVRGAWLAFGFGLLHGFGFASVLTEVNAEGSPLWRTLLAFNLGVEVGQLAIVAVFLPIAFYLRHTAFYRKGVVYGGSTVAGLCALLWFVRRAF